MRVHWTENAIKHLADIHAYISENSQIYAARIVDRLTKRSEQIGAFPRSGRVVSEFQAEDIREMIEKPYHIIYRLKAEQIDALTVIHGARQIDSNMIG